MKYAYVRVSSLKQFRTGIGLDEQISKLKLVGFDELVVEEFTGDNTKRPYFNSLIQKLQEGDTLIATKLDRFANSISTGFALINDLLKRGIAVHILNIGLIDNTPVSKSTVSIFSAFAEYEKDMIIERYLTGREITRSENGYRGKKPTIDQKKKDFAVDLIVNQHKSYNEVVSIMGFSKATLIRAVKAYRAKKILSEESEVKP